MYALVTGLVLATLMLRLWLEWRQQKHLAIQRREEPPSWMDKAGLERSIGVALQRSRIASAAIVAEAGCALLLVGGGLAVLEDAGRIVGLPPEMQAAVPAAVALAAVGLIRRCGEAANVFRADAASGLGRPPLALFLKGALVSLGAASCVSFPVLLSAAVLLDNGWRGWWVATWAIWLALTIADGTLRPFAVARLHYAATELQDHALSARIEALLRHTGLRLGRVRVLDASRRTRRANASVHGLGATKHIMLHDTLLERLGPPEVLAVIGHEAGHARLGHAWKHIGLQAALGFAAAVGLSLGNTSATASTAEYLGLSVLLLLAANFWSRPLVFGLSRHFEYGADAFAAAHVGALEMMRALEALHIANAGTPWNDRIYECFHASHPAARERLGRLREMVTA